MKLYTLDEVAEKKGVTKEAVRYKLLSLMNRDIVIGTKIGHRTFLTASDIKQLHFRLNSLKTRKNAKKCVTAKLFKMRIPPSE